MESSDLISCVVSITSVRRFWMVVLPTPDDPTSAKVCPGPHHGVTARAHTCNGTLRGVGGVKRPHTRDDDVVYADGDGIRAVRERFASL